MDCFIVTDTLSGHGSLCLARDRFFVIVVFISAYSREKCNGAIGNKFTLVIVMMTFGNADVSNCELMHKTCVIWSALVHVN